jgi:NADPH-dependent glutamate synthase beta subunit-like oxidoreductase/pyruvate/2-oxoacid:ferredoxin oxidoreductase beta subunit/ferredoxin
LIYPFPEKDITGFLGSDFNKILILEELDPVIEDQVRVIAQKQKCSTEILGKNFAGLAPIGEYSLDIITGAIENFSGTDLKSGNAQKLQLVEGISSQLPPRPPSLCAGCPHRATFYALKLAVPRYDTSVVMCGDIGCFGLGALAPLQMIDTIHHMGMSISMAQGISEAISQNNNGTKIVALVGDGTFFHSGVASLLNAVYTKSEFTLIIFDNRTVGMTGHQDNPGSVIKQKYRQINIEQLIRGMGIDQVSTIDPFHVRSTYSKLQEALNYKGISVLIAKSPCVFLPEFKNNHLYKKVFKVDHDKCNTCGNHCDSSEWCSKEGSQKNSLARAKAMASGTHHIPAKEQLCPANICNHGFFNSILAGNHKEALEIVRDKMLFSKVCGDICHKPCESLFKNHDRETIPIRDLKKFVSGIEDNFNDFSRQISRATHAIKKGKTVAVVGAGPAGLSAAYDLVQRGYNVTVFEKEAKAGGMVKYILPDFRIDKTGMEKEIAVLEKMGLKFRFNMALGDRITVKLLSEEFDTVVLAIGTWNSETLDVIDKNIPRSNRSNAIRFLKDYNEGNISLKPGATILVIGGGNSAMDAARAARKLSKENKVIVSCIERLDKMPAFAEEIADALHEDIRIIDNSYVHSANSDQDKFSIALYSFDNHASVEELHADYVITAIGQKGDENIVDKNMKADEKSRINSVSYNNVFVCGDLLAGNHNSVIGAIGSGKKAAVSVMKLLENYPYAYEGEFALNKLVESGNEIKSVTAPGTISPGNLLEEIKEFDLFQSCEKCNHCIENFGCPAMIKSDGKVIIDEARCTGCGLCLEVCPNRAIYVEEEEIQLSFQNTQDDKV